ncbi:acyl carrier protein 2, mitochondrial-like isoform X2 [Macadamia integrifolia]|uniref:acyl carrier protein 2, mitochondrial-like isoform X2 n=1 Tax=Macadamia integrifolia TaxID=60698 RepID=UPI001C4F92AB|nr:acyl carrier protein 2, mitochondrial-like isoform X2 [Macadamia integrifolia]
MAARNALLKHLRVNVQSRNATPFAFSLNNLFLRYFSSEEVRGSFLNKSEVADRVISVVKNLQKVDPSKVLHGSDHSPRTSPRTTSSTSAGPMGDSGHAKTRTHTSRLER